jgi:hypothetical protein
MTSRQTVLITAAGLQVKSTLAKKIKMVRDVDKIDP